MTDLTYVQRAERYARAVTKKEIPACWQVKAAAKRYLNDLKRSKTKEFDYRLDEVAAHRACSFIEKLPHTKGKWAFKKERIQLADWQVFIVVNIFGWLHKKTLLRRFRKAYLLIPRKNGKSLLAAAIGLYMFCADNEYGAEVYSGATTEKQAWEVFKPAHSIVKKVPALKKRFGIEVMASNLSRVADGSKFEPLIGDPGDGASPHCSIHDEYHEHKTDSQSDTMETGMGARDQPLQLWISTAGDNLAGPCYARQMDCENVLKGTSTDDQIFILIFTVDDKDDWRDPACLVKANPNFGTSVGDDYLLSRQRDAKNSPRKAGVFTTKHLNRWVASRNAYFDLMAWRRCADPALVLESLFGKRAWLGMDLASTTDIAALELLVDLGEDRFAEWGWYFLPSDTVAENETYSGWDAQGLLNVTDGNVTDYEEIEEKILWIAENFTIQNIGYDPYQASMLVTRLQKHNLPLLNYGQTVKNFSEPMKDVDKLMRTKKIIHRGCPVMTWQMGNVCAKEDRKENVFPNKPDGQNHLKIDNPVALIMARGVSMMPDSRSIYEDRGLITV